MVYDDDWLLPVCGFIVGWFTNFLALKIIFRPLKPVIIGPFKIQGIFLKRQTEVSEVFARIVCKGKESPLVIKGEMIYDLISYFCADLIDTEKMWNEILTGPNRKNFQLMLRAHSINFTEKLIGGLRPLAIAALGTEQFNMMKEDIATQVIEKIPGILPLSYEYTTEALNLECTIRETMSKLSAEEFEGVLHPAFEEDEMTLIMVGGVLGMLVGVIQIVIFMFSG